MNIIIDLANTAAAITGLKEPACRDYAARPWRAYARDVRLHRIGPLMIMWMMALFGMINAFGTLGFAAWIFGAWNFLLPCLREANAP